MNEGRPTTKPNTGVCGTPFDTTVHLHMQDVRIEGRRIRPHDVSTDGQDDVASDDEDGHCVNRPSSRRSLRGPVAATLTLVCSTFINIELAYRPLCNSGAALFGPFDLFCLLSC